ncbi:A1 cistron-splicing factor [Microdochium trichocladiopsis]|uniref:A1 cistron-splicing factor n=1 Tax=Microdochium trichocladiopsis TaxID=1682393 RepID=A0A9P8YGQ9_9PEZI|nr:A1 cistron-splicing factor [Microdochium trichocladiopsis]KAH7037800.1 A1 cistron-splicing factor [Microdochium trichocladiopsis]
MDHHQQDVEGDVLLLDHLPAAVTVGCDAVAFSTTKPFLGCKSIPPGVHLVWIAPSAMHSSRSGHWFVTQRPAFPGEPARIHVRVWDQSTEALVNPPSEDSQATLAQRLPAISAKLPPYHLQFSAAAKTQAVDLPVFMDRESVWDNLTYAIDSGVLEAVTGKPAPDWGVSTSDRVSGEIQPPAEAELYSEASRRLRFTFPADIKLFNPESTGSERTQQALDPTAWVLRTLGDPAGPRRLDHLVGELQFAFLTGMHLGNFSCLEQWWFIVNRIIFRSYELAVSSPALSQSLIRTFHAQIVYNEQFLEGDVFDMMPENTKLLQKSLTTYRSRLMEKLQSLDDSNRTPDHLLLQDTFSALEAWLAQHLGWDLSSDYVRSGTVMLEDGELVEAELSDFEDEDERGEFAATVVELDEQGRPTDMVSWNDT